jgi:hypothetical protein
MIYPARLVKALPLVFSVGAVHDSVTLVGDVTALEEPELLVVPLDEPLEPDVEATGSEATGVEATGVEAREVEAPGVEAIGVLPVEELESVPALAGGVTVATLASDAEPALCDEPPHPDSRTAETTNAPSIWVKKLQRRSIFMCIRLADG